MPGVDFPLPGAGELNKRVAIRLRQDVPVGEHGVDEQHPEVIHRWASLRPVGTGVWTASMQVGEAVTHRAIVRLPLAVTTDHEVVYAGIVYRVRRAADLRGMARFLVLDLETLGEESVLNPVPDPDPDPESGDSDAG